MCDRYDDHVPGRGEGGPAAQPSWFPWPTALASVLAVPAMWVFRRPVEWQWRVTLVAIAMKAPQGAVAVQSPWSAEAALLLQAGYWDCRNGGGARHG
jgi:hypothetical protein